VVVDACVDGACVDGACVDGRDIGVGSVAATSPTTPLVSDAAQPEINKIAAPMVHETAILRTAILLV
jgi:hypothetical protein